MNNIQYAWKQFEQTGNIQDYMTYINSKDDIHLDEGQLPYENKANYTDGSPGDSTVC